MPYIKRPGRSISLGLATLCALFAAALLPGIAAADCPSTPVAKAFSRFYDYNDYSLVDNGAFESGTTGWSLSNSWVVSGNESFKVHGSTDSRSLFLKAGTGTAASPWFCASYAHPTFRFFGRRTNNTWGVLYADVRYRDTAGQVHSLNAGALYGDTYTSWQPSRSMALSIMLPVDLVSNTVPVQLVFRTEPEGGDWTIDDVYVDPYSR
jgi:hypothetical protein